MTKQDESNIKHPDKQICEIRNNQIKQLLNKYLNAWEKDFLSDKLNKFYWSPRQNEKFLEMCDKHGINHGDENIVISKRKSVTLEPHPDIPFCQIEVYRNGFPWMA